MKKRITQTAALLLIEGLGIALLLAIVALGARRAPPAPQLQAQPPQLSLPTPVLRADQPDASFAGS